MAKINLDPKKTPMPEQSAQVRRTNFSEVAQGYDLAAAISEANRCLNCPDMPCVSGCPVNVSIPEFIGKIKSGDIEGAYRVISHASCLPAVCGRVCPQESQCEARCKRGIRGETVAIGRLERFAADVHAENANTECGTKNPQSPPKVPDGAPRVAIIGSGPSGLACAGDLAKMGYTVSVFEALHTVGGVLSYGIPEFRLPKSIVKREADELRALGVEFNTNVIIGKTLGVDELFEMGYAAVFIGTGAGLPTFMGIPGEGLCGVYSANEFLTRVNLMGAYREGAATPVMRGGNVAVVGGGNVAMDAARCAVRLGASRVYIIYRRSEAELPARREEIHHAMEEGVEFIFLASPAEIIGEGGYVKAARCVQMELGEPDARGRRAPHPIPGSEFELPLDTVIMAIGTSPNPLIKLTTEGLDTNARGCIVADGETGKTSREGIFSGGDAVTGAATVISAMGAGKRAAAAIDEYIKSKA